MKFFKYQALGNDYLILPGLARQTLSPELVRQVCDRHFGLGSDGILLPLDPAEAEPGVYGLRIFNPDGSEAEKSGNGLRIFARYLFDQGLVGHVPFMVWTAGGTVRCEVQADDQILVGMGLVSFDSQRIPVIGPARQVVDEAVEVRGKTWRVTALTIGNPHCVVFTPHISAELACQWGPVLETHSLFPNRTNVQFTQVLDAHSIRMEIWERGAGYTLASGSSACAAAAAAILLGRCQPPVQVHMPGGRLLVDLDPEGGLSLLGPASLVAWGDLA